MNAFTVVEGKVAPLDRRNVDTDQIIPKQFLKRIERTGFGEFLFFDWRRNPDGTLNESFVLNDARYEGAAILVAGANFGCGSSREHAPWALADYGFRAIIAPSFADIFSNNCTKNGMLPIVLTEDEVNGILDRASEQPGYELTVDLGAREVRDADGFRGSFNIGEFQRYCLMEGLDDIGLTLKQGDSIAAFEASRPRWLERSVG